MDLIKQFPDISMKERERFRLQQKLYPKRNTNSLPDYENARYLINSQNNKSRNWTRLILMLLLGFALAYIILTTVPDFL